MALLTWGKGSKSPPAPPTAVGAAEPFDPFDLDTPLIQFSPDDVFSLRDACEGVQVFGSIGSGKTSGSGATLAREFLNLGMGGLVCCAKPEERRVWEDYARQTGRLGSLVVVRPGASGEPSPWRFNFLDYELRRTGPGGGLTENVVNLLVQIVEIIEGRQGRRPEQDFWTNAMKELLRNAVDLLSLSGAALTLDNVCKLVLAAPTDANQPHNKQWRASSYTFQCIRAATVQPKNAREANDLSRASSYWLNAFPTTPLETRGGVVATFRGVADILLHGLAWELLATDTNIVPEATYLNGAIIVLDLSILEYREVGRAVQSIWKTMFQQAVLRRDATLHPRPVFLWCDESQYFVTTYDYDYQSTARGARACSVFLTQNINNYQARLGSDAQAHANALLGMFGTKIFHAQSDHTTNQYAADLIGQEWTMTDNWSGQAQGGSSYGQSESVQYIVLPSSFATLRKGGPPNQGAVDAIVVQSGRYWKQGGWSGSGGTFLPVTFRQAS